MAASDFLAGVPPEVLGQVLNAGGSKARREALLAQVQRGQAMQQMGGQRYSNPWAAALGGLANVAGAGIGAYQEKKGQEGLAALEDEQRGGREALLNAYAGGMQKTQVTAPDVIAPNIGLPDASEEQQAMAAALRGEQQEGREEGVRRGTAYLGLLSGDERLQGFGKALMGEGVRDLQAERLETTQEGLALRRLGLQSTEEAREQARKDREARDKAQREFQAGENAKNRASQERAAALSAGQKQVATTEAQTKEFGEEILKTGAPGFYERYDAAKAILDRNKGDLPGFGRIEGRLPDDLISEEGRTLRQSIGQLLSEYRKGQTGAGMSDSERVEYGRITGLLQTGDEQSVRQGIEALKRAIDAKVRATAGGFRPEAVQAYGSRVPRVGAALALPKDASGQPTLEAPSLSPQDAAALAWARDPANAADPRAAAILQRLGVSK